MSGSYRTKPSDVLRIIWQIEGKLPPDKPAKPQPRKRVRLDHLCELEEERAKARGDQSGRKS